MWQCHCGPCWCLFNERTHGGVKSPNLLPGFVCESGLGFKSPETGKRNKPEGVAWDLGTAQLTSPAQAAVRAWGQKDFVGLCISSSWSPLAPWCPSCPTRSR